MDAMLTILFICAGLGLLVGFLAGLLGIGGGLIMVPALTWLFVEYLQLDFAHAMPMAIATSLSTIILTAMSASFTHYKLGNLDKRILIWCAFGIAVGAVAGAQLASSIPATLLKNLFAGLVILIALQMMFGAHKRSSFNVSKPKLVTTGFVTGCVSALMGIGGGALIVPALVWFNVHIKQAIGCASFCSLLVAVFGSASFVVAGWNLHDLPQWSFGYVYLPASVGIVMTSVFTATHGAKISQRINTRWLKRIFAGFLVLVSIKMLLG